MSSFTRCEYIDAPWAHDAFEERLMDESLKGHRLCVPVYYRPPSDQPYACPEEAVGCVRYERDGRSYEQCFCLEHLGDPPGSAFVATWDLPQLRV
jgi:hypothetical protein